MLFACIHAPDFPVQAALQGHSAEFLSHAVVVLDGPESLLKVIACNTAARAAGVAIGMTKLQAESCGVAQLRKRVEEQEDSTQAALLDCGYSFSPRLESTAPGTVIVDFTGSERLLGAAEEIGMRLLRHAEACGFVVNVALAANPDAAMHAARGLKGLTVIAAGEEAARLGSLPIEVLEPPEEILEVLTQWGITDFKSLAALPEVPLTERLGQPGLYLQRLAKGEVQRELKPAEALPSFRESMEPEEAIDLLEPLGFILNRLLEQLTLRLREKSLATDHVQLDLTLEAHPEQQLCADSPALTVNSQFQRTIKLPVPCQDSRTLLKLLQLDLNAHPPEAPVRKIALEAFPARLRYVQAGLFQPLAPEPAKLEITLARLRSVVGAEDGHGRSRVGFPSVLDSHRPDSFQVLPAGFVSVREEDFQSSCQLAVRFFRPALAARVELRQGRPVAVAFHHVRAGVVRAAGPWRVTGAWWDAGGEWQRDEWDLYLNLDGAVALYRVFQDLFTGQWYVEGMYD
jgi:protein ImuB